MMKEDDINNEKDLGVTENSDDQISSNSFGEIGDVDAIVIAEPNRIATTQWVHSNFLEYKKTTSPPNTLKGITKSELITNYSVNESLLSGMTNNQLVRQDLISGVTIITTYPVTDVYYLRDMSFTADLNTLIIGGHTNITNGTTELSYYSNAGNVFSNFVKLTNNNLTSPEPLNYSGSVNSNFKFESLYLSNSDINSSSTKGLVRIGSNPMMNNYNVLVKHKRVSDASTTIDYNFNLFVTQIMFSPNKKFFGYNRVESTTTCAVYNSTTNSQVMSVVTTSQQKVASIFESTDPSFDGSPVFSSLQYCAIWKQNLVNPLSHGIIIFNYTDYDSRLTNIISVEVQQIAHKSIPTNRYYFLLRKTNAYYRFAFSIDIIPAQGGNPSYAVTSNETVLEIPVQTNEIIIAPTKCYGSNANYLVFWFATQKVFKVYDASMHYDLVTTKAVPNMSRYSDTNGPDMVMIVKNNKLFLGAVSGTIDGVNFNGFIILDLPTLTPTVTF